MAIYYNTEELPIFKKAVLTIGTFDGVHHGHRTIIQKLVKHAQETGGESVLITFEPHPRKILFPDKPLKLITPLEDKIELLTQAGIQHIVVVPFTRDFSNLSAKEYVVDFLVKYFQPESIVIGHDHHFGHDRSGNIHLLQELADVYHYKVYEIPAQLIDDAAISSTKIRNAINAGDVTEAAEMLERFFSITGDVIQGAKIGRTIGYPTANIHPSDHDQLIPAKGVYAVLATVNDITYKAMLNIGNRPTVDNDIKLHIEAHLFNFNADIYNTRIKVSFVKRIRDEEKFVSVEALKQQLDKDKATALNILAEI